MALNEAAAAAVASNIVDAMMSDVPEDAKAIARTQYTQMIKAIFDGIREFGEVSPDKPPQMLQGLQVPTQAGLTPVQGIGSIK